MLSYPMARTSSFGFEFLGGLDHPMLEFFSMLVVVQLLSIEIAMRLGNDVDMPRNLVRSVTVE
jgi:glucosamine--fructose-6-phosphate aminotransferase (isomerizing)